MAFSKLTNEGEGFIRKMCGASGNSLLLGKNKLTYTKKDDYYNPNGILPRCIPEISPEKQWLSDSGINGGITTNQQLGEKLIEWYNKYGKIYEINANVLAAQTYRESEYKVWAYALTSTASGISQFTSGTLFDIVIQSYGNQVKFTNDEIKRIQLGMGGVDLTIAKTYGWSETIGKENRAILHQNITNNPELMIKAQSRYMKNIMDSYGSNLTSNVLFGYHQGPGVIDRKSGKYANSIANSYANKNTKPEDVTYGVEYVYKIFKLLYDSFGYKFLNMNQVPVNDKFKDNME